VTPLLPQPPPASPHFDAVHPLSTPQPAILSARPPFDKHSLSLLSKLLF
jgi:hypothetical protein